MYPIIGMPDVLRRAADEAETKSEPSSVTLGVMMRGLPPSTGDHTCDNRFVADTLSGAAGAATTVVDSSFNAGDSGRASARRSTASLPGGRSSAVKDDRSGSP